MPKNSNNWYSVSEVAHLTGISPDTLRRWDESGKFPSKRTRGGHRRYTAKDLAAIQEEVVKMQQETDYGIGTASTPAPITLRHKPAPPPLLTPAQKRVLVGAAFLAAFFTTVTATTATAGFITKFIPQFTRHSPISNSEEITRSQVLGATADPALSQDYTFEVNIPAVFNDKVTIKNLDITDTLKVLGTLDVDSVRQLTGLQRAGSILTALSVGEDAGLSVEGTQALTLTNTDKGSAQHIFKNFKLGSSTAQAGSNSDTFEFAAGSNISLSLDTSGKKLTITNSMDAATPWEESGSSLYPVTLTQNVGIGTQSPTSTLTVVGTAQLTGSAVGSSTGLFVDTAGQVGIGTTSPSSALTIDSGTDDTAGLKFTRLTSASSSGVGGGKVLSVDSGGNLILVTDQTGENQTAENILPTAELGGTLYYNGTVWVSSTNLFHNGGKVGISTTNPTARLETYTNDASTVGLIVKGDTAQSANLQEWRDVNGSILSYIDANGVFNGELNADGTVNPGLTEGYVLYQGASGLTGSNNLFWDSSNSRLGIGTTSPTSYLDVRAGTTKLFQVISDGSASGIALYRASDNYEGQILYNSQYQFPSNGGNFRFGSQTSGLYGTAAEITQRAGNPKYSLVNSSASGAGFNILLTNGDFILESHENYDQLNFNTRFIIKNNSGNVGIGTTNPSSKLDIQSDTTVPTALTLRKSTDQVNPVFEILDNTDSSLFQITGEGNINLPTGTRILWSNSNKSITNSGNVMTLSTFERIGFNLWDGSDYSEMMRLTKEGMLGIGTTSPTSPLHVAGSYGSNAAAVIDQLNSGDIFTASSSGTTRMVLNNTGYLGLGTTNPVENLHLQDATGPRIKFTTDNTLTTGSFNTIGLTSDRKYLEYNAGYNKVAGYGHIFKIDQTLEVMRLEGTGNVGIGTTSPDKTLVVNGHIRLPQTRIYTSSIGNETYYMDFDNGSQVRFNSLNPIYNDNVQTFYGTDFDYGIRYNNSTDNLEMGNAAWGTNNADVVINPSGYIGIGTTSPNYALDVQSGAINVGTGSNAGYKVAGQATLYINNNILNLGTAHAAAQTQFMAGGAARMRLDTNGNLGIGTTSPTSPLHVAGSYGSNAAAVIDQLNSGDIFTASSSGTTRMVLTNDGKLGLGTTNPTYKLEVSDETSPILAITPGGSNTANPTLYLKDTANAHGFQITYNNSTGRTFFDNKYDSSSGDMFFRTRVDGTPINNLTLHATGDAALAGSLTMGTNMGNDELLLSTYSSGDYNAHIVAGDLDRNAAAGIKLYYRDNTGTPLTGAILSGDGFFGIGTTNPTAKLNISSSSENGGIRLDDDTGDAYISMGTALHQAQITLYRGHQGYRNRILFSGANGLTTPWSIGKDSNSDDFYIGSGPSATFGAKHLTLTTRGNIGIGTTSPTSPLHVAGAYAGNAAAVIDQLNSGDIFTASSSGTTRMVLNNTGYLGLGTTNPQYPLDVSGHARFLTDSGPIYLSMDSDRHISHREWQMDYGARADIKNVNSNGWLTFWTGGNDTNSNIRMSILANGNIGIGTTSPNNLLEIISGNSATVTLATDGIVNASKFRIDAESESFPGISNQGDSNTGMDLAGSDRLGLVTAGNYRLFVNAAGNIGIGTTSPTSPLHVAGAYGGNAAAVINQLNSGDIFTASSSGTTKMVLTNDGKLGIGTTSPAEELEVLGTVRLTNNGKSLHLRQSASDTNGMLQVLNTSNTAGNFSAFSGLLTDLKAYNTGDNRTLKFSNNVSESWWGNTSPDTRFYFDSTTSTFLNTAGTSKFLSADEAWTVDGGSTNYTFFELLPTINQTNGASGISRGIYVNPTLTSAADFRAIELTNDAGYGLYQSGSNATNYLAGKLGIGTTNPGRTLEVNGSILAVNDLDTAYDSITNNSTFPLSLRDTGDSDSSLIHLRNKSGGDVFVGNLGDGTANRANFVIKTESGAGNYLNTFWVQHNGLVGIGTTSPTSPLHVAGSYGSNAAGVVDQLNNGDILTASASGVTRMTVDNAGGLALNADTSADAILRLQEAGTTRWSVFNDGDSNDDFYITNSGGTGQYMVNGSSAWSAASDLRLKENVEVVENSLDIVSQLKGYTYNFIGADHTEVGVIAQEVQQVAPWLVSENKDGYLGVAYDRIAPILINAINEQQTQLNEYGQVISPLLTKERLGEVAGVESIASLPDWLQDDFSLTNLLAYLLDSVSRLTTQVSTLTQTTDENAQLLLELQAELDEIIATQTTETTASGPKEAVLGTSSGEPASTSAYATDAFVLEAPAATSAADLLLQDIFRLPQEAVHSIVRYNQSQDAVLTTANPLLVSNDIAATGSAIFRETVTGNLIAEGRIVLNTTEEHLALQDQALQPIEFEAGQIQFSENGDIHLRTGKLVGNPTIRGQVTLNPGETTAVVKMDWVEVPVSVQVTPSYLSQVAVTQLTENGFFIEVSQPPTEPQTLYWLAMW